jgi:four helix bundle protein
MHNFKKMKIWQEACNLVTNVYQLTERIPVSECYGLTSQIQRATVSIPANIAEGAGRTTDLEFKRFLDIAIGSAFELETLVILAGNLGFISEEDATTSTTNISNLYKMILSFKKQL